jgi:cytochrome c
MSFETNKIAGAVLVAMILAMVSGILADRLVEPKLLEKPVYLVAGAEPSSAAAGSTAPAGPEAIGPLMASASVDEGKKISAKCAQCHVFTKGGANKIGPDLYGIVDDEIAHDRGGYAFSSALSGKHGTWTVANLNAWLFKPQTFAPGTKMTFVGLPKAKDRADIVAFLNSMSDSPKPAAALAAEDPAAPAATPAAAPAGQAPKPGAPGAAAPAGAAKPATPAPAPAAAPAAAPSK